MKKSTVIILLVVFLGSVLIVGIFGMQAVPFEKIIYMDKIEITGIITSDRQEVSVTYDEVEKEYRAYINYNPKKVQEQDENGNITEVEEFEVTIAWDYFPKDATNKTVTVTIVEPAKPACKPLTSNGAAGRTDPLVFLRKGNVHLRYSSNDSATGAVADIWLYVGNWE